jgi:hypothetical protein
MYFVLPFRLLCWKYDLETIIKFVLLCFHVYHYNLCYVGIAVVHECEIRSKRQFHLWNNNMMWGSEQALLHSIILQEG